MSYQLSITIFQSHSGKIPYLMMIFNISFMISRSVCRLLNFFLGYCLFNIPGVTYNNNAWTDDYKHAFDVEKLVVETVELFHCSCLLALILVSLLHKPIQVANLIIAGSRRFRILNPLPMKN